MNGEEPPYVDPREVKDWMQREAQLYLRVKKIEGAMLPTAATMGASERGNGSDRGSKYTLYHFVMPIVGTVIMTLTGVVWMFMRQEISDMRVEVNKIPRMEATIESLRESMVRVERGQEKLAEKLDALKK